jgi:shikimate kinase
MKKNISIIGFMGTGKSAIGRNIARELNFRFIDTDRYIERKIGISISEYFAKNGEIEFRKIENFYLKEILKNERQVISTGGGIVLLEENRELLKEQSFVVSLKAMAKTIYYRIKRNNKRPLLRTQKPLKTINNLMNQRKGLYDFGDIILYTDNSSIIELAKKVVNTYKSQ